jgi:aspartate carbamoyltransferase regulatory subunit
MNSQIQRIYAPFTPTQITQLNKFQYNAKQRGSSPDSDSRHPFTCGNSNCIDEHNNRTALLARERGWICPSCAYTQTWAHKFMAEDQTP